MVISKLPVFIPIVDITGKMSLLFRKFADLLTELPVIVGTGSPEGVITAGIGRLYMDDSGTAGSILYVRKLTDIGGDKTLGWTLV